MPHHDEAHTHHQLSQNLTTSNLRDAKRNWLATVKSQRNKIATLSGQLALNSNNQLSLTGMTWGYINHRRVGQLANPEKLEPQEQSYFQYCRRKGIVDQRGILIKPAGVRLSSGYIGNSIYDWYEHGDDQRLHLVYSAFVDQISTSAQPTHLDNNSWTKARIRSLVRPGAFIFLDRAFFFKSVRESRHNQHRRVYTFRRKVVLEFYVDTVDMFGTTSMTVSFSGHKQCGALVQLKTIEEKKDGRLILHCTPIALGVGFSKQRVVN